MAESCVADQQRRTCSKYSKYSREHKELFAVLAVH